jgi:hypothetical protein
MCDEHFAQCLLLAEHRIAAFSAPKYNCPNQYETTFDTPELYLKIPNYFTSDRCASSSPFSSHSLFMARLLQVQFVSHRVGWWTKDENWSARGL